MPGLVPGIHVLLDGHKDVDGRDKPGHDDNEMGSALKTSLPLLLVGLEVCVGDAQFRYRHLAGIAARDQVADHMVGFDPGRSP